MAKRKQLKFRFAAKTPDDSSSYRIRWSYKKSLLAVLMLFGCVELADSAFCRTLQSTQSTVRGFENGDGPSFDCSSNLSPTENAICNSPELSKRDTILAERYRLMLATPQNLESAAKLKRGQKAFLATRNACGAEVSCIQDTYRNRMMALNPDSSESGSIGAANPLQMNDNSILASQGQFRDAGIEFSFNNTIGGYTVSGIWYPVEDTYPQTLLAGPVVFTLKSLETGQVIKVTENAVSLLNDQYFTSRQIDIETYKDKQVELVSKLKSERILQLNYDEADRAKKAHCGNSKDICLRLGNVPIDLQDIDFDGKPEIVIRQKAMGQRSGDAFAIYSLDFTKKSNELGVVPYDNSERSKIFRSIDDFSTIDLTTKQIRIYASDGACQNSEEVYTQKTEDSITFLPLTEFWHLREGRDGYCLKDTYDVETSETGVPKYTLVSSTKFEH